MLSVLWAVAGDVEGGEAGGMFGKFVLRVSVSMSRLSY